jgi:Fic family protein
MKTKLDALNEALAISGIDEEIREGEFTAHEFAEHAKIPYRTALDRLREMVSKGAVSRRRVTISGSHGFAYSTRE